MACLLLEVSRGTMAIIANIAAASIASPQPGLPITMSKDMSRFQVFTERVPDRDICLLGETPFAQRGYPPPSCRVTVGVLEPLRGPGKVRKLGGQLSVRLHHRPDRLFLPAVLGVRETTHRTHPTFITASITGGPSAVPHLPVPTRLQRRELLLPSVQNHHPWPSLR